MDNALISLFYQAEDYFFSSISAEELIFDQQAKAYLTGVQAGNLNPLVFKARAASTEEILLKSAKFYHDRHAPWNTVIPEMIWSVKMEKHLKAIGFGVVEKSVTMWLSMSALNAFNPAQERDIRKVDDHLEEWQKPLVEAFESTQAITEQYRQCHIRAQKRHAHFHHFTLYVNDQPVSSLTLSLHNKNSRIDDVGTLPAYQNQGHATHLLRFALEEARKLGVIYCFLEASQYGFSIYQNIGFSPLFINFLAGKVS